jgi:hypothetical protein
MRNTLLTLVLVLIANQAVCQVGAITKAIRGAEAASEAANAARATKAGTKIMATEGASGAISGSEKVISTETNVLIASRAAQIVSNCKSSSKSKNKDIECNKKSELFQHCVASELEHTSLTNTAIDRCNKIYN